MSLQTEMKTVLAHIKSDAELVGMSENSFYDKILIDIAGGTATTYVDALIAWATGQTLPLAAAQITADEALVVAIKNKVGETVSSIMFLDSAVSIGGGVGETMSVVGLLTTDTLLGVTLQTAGANPAYLQSFAGTCAVADQLPVVYSADPGAGAIVRVALKR